MKQVKNRKPGTFKPGKSGNPKGRPRKEWTWRGLLLEAAEAIDPDSGKTVKDVVASALVAKAAAGDVAAIKEFGDRIDGKSRQGLEVSGPDGSPIETSLTVSFVRPHEQHPGS